jgi:valyl-tRNA synthetase
MFGDVAIAVHPEDERYKDMIGKTVILPLVGKEIPIIADEYPDPEKGTGAVKITPAHDPNDFEVGERHQLERPSCIDPDAKMNALAGKYEGMDRFECRKKWSAELEEAGFLVKTEEKVIPSGECYRCSTVIESMLSDQWFVAMEELAKPAIEAAKSGQLVHVPDRFEKTYLHWLENIRDWCISRQLWWGHRIPAYYCDECGELMVQTEAPAVCSKCGSKKIRQDEDVLDTWFSSGLWPFSTLGWPEETEDYKYFYPTNVLVTGYDIIFFWVVRMVFSAIEMTGELPFKHVYVHGLVRDAEGRKMSKSLGNGIDPLEIIDQFGADALRFMLTTGISPGNDMRFKTDKLESSRNFANKLWNASRFVIMNLQDEEGNFLETPETLEHLELREEDKWILSRVNSAVSYVTDNLEKFELSLAGQRVYEVIWNEFCDWYIELVKNRLYQGDDEEKRVVRAVLVHTLKDMLKLLHPFMPYITEEIYSYLPKGTPEADNPDDFLMKGAWPVYDDALEYPEEVKTIEIAMEAIKSIRNIRAEAEAAPGRKLRAVILAEGEGAAAMESCRRYIMNLANITEILLTSDKKETPDEAMSAIITGAEIFIPLDDLLDYKAEFERLSREKKKLEDEVARLEKKLSNEGFVAKAPPQIIAEEREKAAGYQDKLEKIQERLDLVARKC